MRSKLSTIVVVALLAGLPLAAAAGPHEAVEAYRAGDYAGVLRECEAAAKAGDAICQDLLGLLYSEGKGVKADQVVAVRWFRLSADQGNPIAAYNLALAYQTGQGVAKDSNQAKKWYAAAAEKGLALANNDTKIVPGHGALGTKADLVRNSFGSRSQVLARFAGAQERVADWVAQRGGQTVGGSAQFTIEHPTEIGALLEASEKAGFELLDVSLRKPNLESVFLRLTGRELRD